MINLKTEIAKIIAEIPNPKSYQRRIIINPSLQAALTKYMEPLDITNINEAIYCIANDMTPVKCKCGSNAVFNSYVKGYRKFCGLSCPEKGKNHSTKITEFWDKNPDVKDQMVQNIKKTMKETHGVDNAMKVPEFRKRHEESLHQTHGVTTPFESAAIQQKAIETTMKNHGVSYPLQSPAIREKAAQTFEKNHGYKNDMRIPRQLAPNNKHQYNDENN